MDAQMQCKIHIFSVQFPLHLIRLTYGGVKMVTDKKFLPRHIYMHWE